MDLKIGDILRVCLEEETLVGCLKFYDPECDMLEIANAKEESFGYVYANPQKISLSAVRKLSRLKAESGSENELVPQSPSSMEVTFQERVDLSSCDHQQIDHQIKELIVITQTDCKYYQALRAIRQQSVAAVVMEPTHNRYWQPAMIAIATQVAVYIFDMQALGQKCSELKAVLQGERPRKAVHYCHWHEEQLQSLGISTASGGLFDTFIAYCKITKSNQPLSLVDTLHKCFNLPPLYFELPKKSQVHYYPYHRPLTPEVRQMIGKRVIFQYKLFDHLLHKGMLARFYRQCDEFAKDSHPLEVVNFTNTKISQFVEKHLTADEVNGEI